MDSAPDRSPRGRSVDGRSGGLWRARGGLVLVAALTLGSATVWMGLVGRGAGSAAVALRGPDADPASREAGPTATAGSATTLVAPAVSTPLSSLPPVLPTPQPGLQTAPPASPTSAPQQTPQQAPQPTPSTAAAPPRREHTVATGDTLSAIAQRYGTTVDALVAANRLPNRNTTLQVGQRLVVPG